METGHPKEKDSIIREPLLVTAQPPSKGGFRTIPFILANEALDKVASYGLLPNMILYLTTEYGMTAAQATNVIYLWSAATNFAPIIGAFLADSHVGRFRMIGFGSIVTLLGMFLLWTTTLFPQAKLPCEIYSNSCQSPTAAQLLLLYSSFALMSIGAGGTRSSSLAFGADQLTKTPQTSKADAASALESLFRWYYITVMVAALLAQTCIVYIQASLGWKVGFGIPVVLMFLSIISFFLASPFYIKVKPSSNFLTSLVQVPVASFRNRYIHLSSDKETMYHHKKGSSLVTPSEKLRFLNKACIISNPLEDLTPNGNASNPWSLCTVDQVEALKSLVKIIPIWSTGIILGVTFCQATFMVLEVKSMDRHTFIPGFEIPAGSFGVFMVISLTIFIPLYDRVIIPLASRIRRKPTRLSLKQRMGAGLIFCILSIASLAIAESFRRENAVKQGFIDNPKAVTTMSAMWTLPYMILLGIAEALTAIAQNEFYYAELPKTMSSIATTLYGVGTSAASLLSSLIISIVDKVSRRWGDESWVSSNINKGHLDYYYWLITSLCLLNFVYFVGCSKAYGESKGVEGAVEEEGM